MQSRQAGAARRGARLIEELSKSSQRRLIDPHDAILMTCCVPLIVIVFDTAWQGFTVVPIACLNGARREEICQQIKTWRSFDGPKDIDPELVAVANGK